jgi:hypothetical protein
MRHSRGLFGAFLGLLVGYAVTPATAADGQMTWGVHISLAPTWFDPAEAPGFITPFMLYSIRGALAEDLKRNPGLTLKPTTIPGTFWLLVTEELGFLGGPRVRPLATGCRGSSAGSGCPRRLSRPRRP